MPMLLRVVRISSMVLPVISAMDTSDRPTVLAACIRLGVKGSCASLFSTSVMFLSLFINHLSTLVMA